MKILITNIMLSCSHGSENFSLSIADELRAQGYAVDFFTTGIGWFADYLKSKGHSIFTPENPPTGAYDFGLINHGNLLSEFIRGVLIGKYIFITHGRIPEETPPLIWEKGRYGYLAMTSEVRNYWQSKVQKEIQVINNPVCDDYYHADPLEWKRLRHILWGNHRREIPVELTDYCVEQDIRLSGGFIHEVPERIMQETFKSQMVIGTGRWIYQAMAAGRSCLIADDKRVSGYLTPENYPEFIKTNMTTRNPSAREIKPGDWRLLLENYDYEMGEKLRDIALENHHVEKIVDDIMEFANAL